MKELELDADGQGSGEPVHVQLVRVEPFRLEENLMPLRVGELHDLVLDRWAIPRTPRRDGAAVQRRLLQVPADDVLHFLTGPRDPARHLTGPLDPFKEGEAVRGRVTVLPLDLGPIDRAAVHPRRRAGLET